MSFITDHPFSFSSSSRRSDYNIFNTNYSSAEQICTAMTTTMMMEKRQLFLRSYQFSRKRTVAEMIKGFTVKVKRVILFRQRSAKRVRKLVWSALCFRRRRFLRLVNGDAFCYSASGMRDERSCLW